MSSAPAHRFPVRALLVVLAVLAAVLVGAPSSASAGPGFAPGDAPQRTFTYEVRTRGTVYADVNVFRRVAAQTLNDRRGWSLGGSIRYREVSSGGTFTLWLAAPSELPKFSSVCDSEYSCRVGRNVIINDERWRTGTPAWPDVAEYRHYVINHELGHWLGRGHATCPGRGQLAPVMQQQSIGLGGCVTNPGPVASEKQAVGATWGVSVRSTRPDLYVVKQHGSTGTEVHVIDGAGRYTAFESHLTTLSPQTAPGNWDFPVADVDRDGVDDLVAVERWGDTGRVEVHVLDGASRYRTTQLHVNTPLPRSAPGIWTFDVADMNRDGYVDIVAVNRQGGSNRTTVYVLSGRDDFTRIQASVATPLTTTDANWLFATGDHDRDGIPDLYVIKRRGSSGHTEVHVLDGATGFHTWIAHAVTPIGLTDDSWDFAVDDLDGDGWDDVFGIQRNGSSGHTEMHVLADHTYASYGGHAVLPLPGTDGQPGWRYLID
jgi:hypothetical protein